MPLSQKDSNEAVSGNIRQLAREGYKQNQAVAIALETRRRARRKKAKKAKKRRAVFLDGMPVPVGVAVASLDAAGCPGWATALFLATASFARDRSTYEEHVVTRGKNKGQRRLRHKKTGKLYPVPEDWDKSTTVPEGGYYYASHTPLDLSKPVPAYVPPAVVWGQVVEDDLEAARKKHAPHLPSRIGGVLLHGGDDLWNLNQRHLDPSSDLPYVYRVSPPARVHTGSIDHIYDVEKVRRYHGGTTGDIEAANVARRYWETMPTASPRHYVAEGPVHIEAPHSGAAIRAAGRAWDLPPAARAAVKEAEAGSSEAVLELADWLEESGRHDDFARRVRSEITGGWVAAGGVGRMIREHFLGLKTHEALDRVDLSKVPVVSEDRWMRRTDLVKAAKKLFRSLGVPDISITQDGSYIAVRVPGRRDADPDYQGRPMQYEPHRANRRARQKVEAILSRAFPNHDDRSNSQVDHFDFIWSIQ